MKLLAINASPKQTGTTAGLLQDFIKAAEKINIKVTPWQLYEHESVVHSGKISKDMERLSETQRQVLAADGFVIATPTYWFNVPGVLKNFIDSLTVLEENELLEGKVAGFIVYSPEGGEYGVLSSLLLPLNHMGVLFPPYSSIFYRGEQDTWVKQDIIDLAKRLQVLFEALQKGNVKWDHWEI